MDPDSGVGALSQLAYGDQGGPINAGTVPNIMNATVSPEDANRLEKMSFWGAFSSPEGNPLRELGTGMGAGLRAQAGTAMEEQKLRAAYVPLIMQSIIQQQNMTLQAAKNTRDWLAQVNPKFNTHMGTMAPFATQGAVPSYQDTVNHAADFIQSNQLPAYVSKPMLEHIPQDDAQRGQWLNRLGAEAAGMDKLVPSVTKNAQDQSVLYSPMTGGISQPGVAPAQPAGGGGAAPATAPNLNPSKTQVQWAGEAMGDPKKYTETLSGENQVMHDMVSRLAEQVNLYNDFQAGRYAKPVGGVAAAAKDIATRLGIPVEKANAIANKLVGANPSDPTNGVAAQQAIGMFGTTEVLKQLQDASNNGRINQTEYRNFSAAFDTMGKDPESVKLLYDYSRNRYADYANRYSAWSNYLKNAQNPSVSDFDSAYHSQAAQNLATGSNRDLPMQGAVVQPQPVAANNKLQAQGTTLGPQPVKTAPAPTQAPPVQAAGPGKQQLAGIQKKFPGAVVSKSGRVMVPDKTSSTGFRYVKVD